MNKGFSFLFHTKRGRTYSACGVFNEIMKLFGIILLPDLIKRAAKGVVTRFEASLAGDASGFALNFPPPRPVDGEPGPANVPGRSDSGKQYSSAAIPCLHIAFLPAAGHVHVTTAQSGGSSEDCPSFLWSSK